MIRIFILKNLWIDFRLKCWNWHFPVLSSRHLKRLLIQPIVLAFGRLLLFLLLWISISVSQGRCSKLKTRNMRNTFAPLAHVYPPY